MDSKEIRELIEMISRSNFSTFELEEADGFKLRLVKKQESTAPPVVRVASPPVAPAPAVPSVAQGATAPPAPAEPAESAPPVPVSAPPTDLVDFDSPIVGTFYRSASPDAPVFADLGQTVKKGQVLCIVEAMKVMNEIESEINAEIVEVCVEDGQPVEFGEFLFRLRPLG